MSQTHTETHAKPQHGEDKKHGDPLDSAMTEADAHSNPDRPVDPVPAPEQSTHSHSHAAHLKDANTKEDNYVTGVREGANPNTLRQPPSFQERAGRATKGS